MSAEQNRSFGETAHETLSRAIAHEGAAVVVGSADGNGMVLLTRASGGPVDFINIAHALLNLALDQQREALRAEDGDSQGDDPREQLVSSLLDVLDELEPYTDKEKLSDMGFDT
jgi:hypothetical protein